MRSLRKVTAGAVVLFVSGAAVSGAAAQTATADTAGKPLQLLRIVEQPLRPRATAHAKIHAAIHRTIAARSNKRHSVVAETNAEPSEPPAQAMAAQASSADDTDATAPAGVAAVEPAPQPASPPSEPAVGPLVVGNQAVQVASQTDVNAIDLAADTARPVPAAPNNATAKIAMPNPEPNDKVAADPAPAVTGEAASKSDSIKAAPLPHAVRSPVGSPGWIAQVMAALAGAVAAGSIAWFLIGAAPQRTYG
jgi:hypothetical protein